MMNTAYRVPDLEKEEVKMLTKIRVKDEKIKELESENSRLQAEVDEIYLHKRDLSKSKNFADEQQAFIDALLADCFKYAELAEKKHIAESDIKNLRA